MKNDDTAREIEKLKGVLDTLLKVSMVKPLLYSVTNLFGSSQ